MTKRLTLLTLAIAALVVAPAANAGGGHGHRGHHAGYVGGKHHVGGKHPGGGKHHGGKRCGGGAKACRNTIVSLDVAASALGLGSAQVKASLSSGQSLAQQAAAAGKTVDAVAGAVVSAAQTSLNTLVANGSLTTSQAQAVLLGVPQQVTALLTGALNADCGLIRLDVSVAASLLGLTNAQLLAQLAAGKTLAELASATGKTVTTLVQGLATTATSNVPTAVSSGAITQTQATTLTNTVTQAVTSIATKPLGG